MNDVKTIGGGCKAFSDDNTKAFLLNNKKMLEGRGSKLSKNVLHNF